MRVLLVKARVKWLSNGFVSTSFTTSASSRPSASPCSLNYPLNGVSRKFVSRSASSASSLASAPAACIKYHNTEHPLKGLTVMQEVITSIEERSLLEEMETSLRRRRYMTGHWDHVIEKYKEVEKQQWTDAENEKVIHRIRGLITDYVQLPQDTPFLPVHVIDLAEDGFIRPHVDNIKFSGGFVCGLSLLSPAIMRLKGEKQPESRIDLMLEPRSLYVLSGEARYNYAHEILGQEEENEWDGQPVKRGRRISLMFRDALTDDDGKQGGGGT